MDNTSPENSQGNLMNPQEESLYETHKHISLVGKHMNTIVMELLKRANEHDSSKWENPEREIYAKNYHKLKTIEYGTKEYDENKKIVEPAILHHYSKNRHHPEHHENGINDMTLVDLVEMLVDWLSATERNKNGNIRKSITHNSKKFKICKQLEQILENTIKQDLHS